MSNFFLKTSTLTIAVAGILIQTHGVMIEATADADTQITSQTQKCSQMDYLDDDDHHDSSFTRYRSHSCDSGSSDSSKKSDSYYENSHDEDHLHEGRRKKSKERREKRKHRKWIKRMRRIYGGDADKYDWKWFNGNAHGRPWGGYNSRVARYLAAFGDQHPKDKDYDHDHDDVPMVHSDDCPLTSKPLETHADEHGGHHIGHLDYQHHD